MIRRFLNGTTRQVEDLTHRKMGQPLSLIHIFPAQSYGYLALDVMSSTNPKPVWSRTRTIADGLSVDAGSITRIANVTVRTVAPHVYKVGDIYPNGAVGGDVKGIVFEAAQDGQSGKIAALKDCSVNGTEVSDEIGTYYWYSWGPSAAALNSDVYKRQVYCRRVRLYE